ncbi:glycosyltransferase family 4 protein [Bacillus smithii]|uniref:glycosyltransferase family 4 protein n=1 Tax=Bacillus smithii TaxID=1479 RepID=UPI0030C8F073
MNICMLTSYFFPTIGGVETHIYNIAKALNNLGNNVIVFHTVLEAPPNGQEFVEENCDGVRVYRLYLLEKNKNKWINFTGDNRISFLYGFINKALPNLYAKKVKKYFEKLNEKYKFDILHQHDFSASIRVTKMLRNYIPVVLTNHTGEFLMINRNKILRTSLRFLLSHYQHIIGPSHELSQVDFMKKRNVVTYIPNGVEIDKFRTITSESQKDLKKQLGYDEDTMLVLCTRRWAPTKGVKYFVESIPIVLEKLREKRIKVRFLISGNEYTGYPQYKEEIFRFIKDKKLDKDIDLLGNIPHTQMERYIQTSDIIVLPSLMEATSLSALEAMSCGKPLIGTNVGGIPEIISHLKNGILVEPKNPSELAKWIVNLIEDPLLRNKLGLNARKTVEENFDWAVIANKTKKVYELILRNHKCKKM